MIKRIDTIQLFIFSLGVMINFYSFVFAQDDQDNYADLALNRPVIEYKAAGLRDPFQTCIIKENTVNGQAVSGAADSKINFSELKVEGVIWGAKINQAIIDHTIYVVGDMIEDAEIISIDKTGINLKYAAGIVNLPMPGTGNVSDKEE